MHLLRPFALLTAALAVFGAAEIFCIKEAGA